jgi:uncharacterized membrane protein
MIDSNGRSLAKTLTWRITGSASTFSIAYLITGSFGVSSVIAFVQMGVNTVLYWLHERAWARVSWGRN